MVLFAFLIKAIRNFTIFEIPCNYNIIEINYLGHLMVFPSIKPRLKKEAFKSNIEFIWVTL